MATEPHGAARPRGTRFIALPAACAAAAAACLAGCSSESAGVSAAPARAASASAAAPDAQPAAASAPSAAGRSAGAASGGGGIPGAAWIASSSIPLNAAYHWSTPSSAAKAAESPVLSAVQDCRLSLSASDESELGAFPAARADLHPAGGATGGQDDWSAQETILATNDTSSGDVQGIYGLYTDLVAALGTCAKTMPGAKISGVTSKGAAAFAATVTIPTSTGTTLTWHEYLAAPYGYLAELSVWVAPYAGDKAGAAWDGSSAAAVLSALESGPCSVTKLC